MEFPRDFIWGAATASYQVEGAVRADGRGDSVWDAFVREPGRVLNGDTGDIACDHYHRYAEDVDLMRQIGLRAYRFSFAWPRLFPDGVGRRNEAGFAFYDRLIDTLLAAGIQPWATLFHWDFPLALERERGGWLNRDSADWFADYARAVAERFSDRIQHWFTLNEPQVFVGHGYFHGGHAPGMHLPLSYCLQITHHALLAHGKAVQALRAHAKKAPRIGYAPVGFFAIPETERPQDIEAARKASWRVTTDPKTSGRYKDDSAVWNGVWYTDPVFFGKYPEEAWEGYGVNVPRVQAGDLETIHQPLDFFGANVYTASVVRMGQDGEPELVNPPPGLPRNTYGWEIRPSCLYWGARFFYERYQKPIYYTENGTCVVEWPDAQGRVADPARIQYIESHLAGIGRAIKEGIPVKGYFHWSLMDNFEWDRGYTQRFGLVYIDQTTNRRYPKDSAWRYRDIIASHGSILPEA